MSWTEMRTDFASEAEQREHYRQIRRRMPPREQIVMVMPPAPEPIAAPEPESPPEPEPPPISVYDTSFEHPMRRMGKIVAQHYQVPWKEIVGPKRLGKFVQPRHVFCWIAHYRMNQSNPQIGRIIERDHTSILNAHRRISADLEGGDEALAATIDAIWGRYQSALSGPAT